MSYQLPRPQGSAGNTAPPLPGGSQNQESVQQAKEKIRRVVETQHSDLKRKFDQIRHSLAEKEEQVSQQLDQVLIDRLNELDTCAKNINLLSETYSLNQQKLGTNTLGDVNFKILTTVSASIEEFRKKIDTEPSIRILWGSQDIEQSIKSICTVSEPHRRHSPPPAVPSARGQGAHSGGNGPCQCVYCQSPSPTQAHHKCEAGGQFQVTDNPIYGAIQPHNLKEPYSVQAVYPPIFVPVEGPVMPRRISDAPRFPGDATSLRITPMACAACGQIFTSIAEIETHKREGQCAPMTSSLSAHRGPAQELPAPQPHFYQLGQQQQSAALNNFNPVHEETRYRQVSNPPHYTSANNQHVPAPQQNLPYSQQPTVSGISNFSPSVQQINLSPRIVANNAPLLDTPQRLQTPDPGPPFLSHPLAQSQVRMPPVLPHPRAFTQPIGPPKETPAKADPPANELEPQSPSAYKMPLPIHPAPPPVQRHANSAHKYGDQIRIFKVLLIWYKQVDTMGDRVFYFDNFDGCCDLVWDRRQEYYKCDTELEEGQHYGQLTLVDSGMYTVEKFHIPLIAPSDQSKVILKIVPTN